MLKLACASVAGGIIVSCKASMAFQACMCVCVCIGMCRCADAESDDGFFGMKANKKS